jgi:hypothetical protein
VERTLSIGHVGWVANLDLVSELMVAVYVGVVVGVVFVQATRSGIYERGVCTKRMHTSTWKHEKIHLCPFGSFDGVIMPKVAFKQNGSLRPQKAHDALLLLSQLTIALPTSTSRLERYTLL